MYKIILEIYCKICRMKCASSNSLWHCFLSLTFLFSPFLFIYNFLRYNLHTINFTHCKRTYNLMLFTKFTELCMPKKMQFVNIFIPPRNSLELVCGQFPLLPRPHANIDLFSVSINLHFTDTLFLNFFCYMKNSIYYD